MKKILKTISLLTLLFSINSFANELQFEKDLQNLETQRLNKRNNPSGSIQNTESITGVESDKGSYAMTPEFSFFYIQFGKPIISYNNEKHFGNSLSFGHKRIADTFVYGAEYNYTKINSNSKINDLSLQLGFQTIWRHRFQPFLTFNFGTAFLKDNILKFDATGYKTSLDVGINLNPYSFFKFYSGMRYNIYSFSQNEIKSIKSQEIYLMIGIDI